MIRTILVPLDGSDFAEAALDLAFPLAIEHGARLVLATVLPDAEPSPSAGARPEDGRADPARESGRRYLADVAERLEGRVLEGRDLEVETLLLEGDIVDALETAIHDIAADLVAMTTHGRGGLDRAWLGSVADELVRLAPAPVLLVRPSEAKSGEPGRRPDIIAPGAPFRRILIPLDGSERSEKVLPLAVQLADPEEAELTLFRTAEPIIPIDHAVGALGLITDASDLEYREQEAARYLDRVAAPLRERGLVVHTRVDRVVQPAVAILEAARQLDADLIAMATRGHGGVTRFLIGSVADKVLRSADTPLLLVRPRDEDES